MWGCVITTSGGILWADKQRKEKREAQDE